MAFADQSLNNQSSALRINLMVVDDDNVFLGIMSRMLEKSKYRDPSIMEITVIAVEDPREALSILSVQRNNIDLIITDYYMPNMNGVQLKEKITQEFGNLPVILMSGDTNIEQESVSCGAMCFVPKPIKATELTKIYEIALTCKKNGKSILWTEPNHKDTHVSISQEIQLLPEQENFMKTKVKKFSPRPDSRSVNTNGSCVSTDGSRKRKPNGGSGNNVESLSQPSKKKKIKWTGSLHDLFLQAIHHIGLEKAVPNKILEFMNLPTLTRENVASHLQKYRLFLKNATKGLSSSNMLPGSGMDSMYPSMRELSRYTPLSRYDTSLNNRSFYSTLGQGLGQSRLLSNTAEPVRFNQRPYNYMSRSSTYEHHRIGSNLTLPIKSNLSFPSQPSQNEERRSFLEPTVMVNKSQTSQVLGFGQHGLSAINFNSFNNNTLRSYGSLTLNQPRVSSYGSSTSAQPGMTSHGSLTPNQPGIISNGSSTSAQPIMNIHESLTPNQLGMNSYGSLTSTQPEMSSHGSLSPKQPGMSSYESFTSNQTRMTSHGSLNPNQLGIISNGSSTSAQPGMSIHGSLNPNQLGMNSNGSLTSTQPEMSSHGSLSPKQPGMISYESFTSNQTRMTSHGSLNPNQPGIISNGSSTSAQPGMSIHGSLTPNQLGMNSYGSLTSTQPEMSRHGSLFPKQPGMSSYESFTSNQTRMTSHGSLYPNQPEMSSYGNSTSSNQLGLSSHGSLTPNQSGVNIYGSATQNAGLNSYGTLTPHQPGSSNFSYELQSFLNNENTEYTPQPQGNATTQPNVEIPEVENINLYDELVNASEIPCNTSNLQFDHNEILSLEEDGDWTFLNTNQGHSNGETSNNIAPETNSPVFNMNPNHDQEQDVQDFVDWSLLNPEDLTNEFDFMDFPFTNYMS